MSVVYAMFIAAVITKFDRFNLLLQTEAPQIHLVHPATMELYRDLLCCLVEPKVVLEYGDKLLDLPFEDPAVQRNDHGVFIGFAASREIVSSDADAASVKKFKLEVRNFYVNALSYIKKKFPLNDLC